MQQQIDEGQEDEGVGGVEALLQDDPEGGKAGQPAEMQQWVKEGALDVVITAAYERTTTRYGERGVRYVHMEAGHAAQNLCLQATAMGLATVPVGAFHDDDVAKILELPEDEDPLYIIPVGKSN